MMNPCCQNKTVVDKREHNQIGRLNFTLYNRGVQLGSQKLLFNFGSIAHKGIYFQTRQLPFQLQNHGGSQTGTDGEGAAKLQRSGLPLIHH